MGGGESGVTVLVFETRRVEDHPFLEVFIVLRQCQLGKGRFRNVVVVVVVVIIIIIITTTTTVGHKKAT